MRRRRLRAALSRAMSSFTPTPRQPIIDALIEDVRTEKRELWFDVEARRERVKASGLTARLMYDAYYREALQRLQREAW